MKIVLLSGSPIGSTTKVAMEYTERLLQKEATENELTLIDLAQKDIQFSDGRNYLTYEGDTKEVTEAIMQADAIIIGTPIFQASIPGALKNIFDLLPMQAFREKVVSILVTAGSAKHYLVAEQQLKPILSYMKAQIVQTYVYIEEKDFYREEIINDDILFRLDRLVDDTLTLLQVTKEIQAIKDAQYDF